jgi:hypothetical protein
LAAAVSATTAAAAAASFTAKKDLHKAEFFKLHRLSTYIRECPVSPTTVGQRTSYLRATPKHLTHVPADKQYIISTMWRNHIHKHQTFTLIPRKNLQTIILPRLKLTAGHIRPADKPARQSRIISVQTIPTMLQGRHQPPTNRFTRKRTVRRRLRPQLQRARQIFQINHHAVNGS